MGVPGSGFFIGSPCLWRYRQSSPFAYSMELRPGTNLSWRRSSCDPTSCGRYLLDSCNSVRSSSDRKKICARSEEHTSELQSHLNLVCRLLLEKKNHIA